jgi:hypothetical protein
VIGGLTLAACGGDDAQKRAITPTTEKRKGPPPTSSSPQAARPTAPNPPARRQQPQPIPPPKPAKRASAADTRVIKAWTDELRKGHVAKAADYFGLPALVENNTPPLRLKTRRDALAFNASFPCGAKFRRAVKIGPYTTVVFRLTNRPGGDCGQGVGHAAATAFVIRKGKIVEWHRIDERLVPPEGVVPPTGDTAPEAPTLPPGKRPPSQQAPTATGPII